MILTHKDWLNVPTLMEKLRDLFEELPDGELDNLKKLAIEAEKRCSETPSRYLNVPSGTLP